MLRRAALEEIGHKHNSIKAGSKHISSLQRLRRHAKDIVDIDNPYLRGAGARNICSVRYATFVNRNR
jgi:hypothetical protein